MQDNIIKIAGVKASTLFEKYLGLLAFFGTNTAKSFQFFIDKAWGHMSNWKIKYLSAASREIMPKAVIQMIPTYSMKIFLLPKSIYTILNSLLNKFW